MLLLAVLLSSWAAAVGGGASRADRAIEWRVGAPSGPVTPVWLEGGRLPPAAKESRGNKVGSAGGGAGAALVRVPMAARTGAAGWRTGFGATRAGDLGGRPGGRWTRGPPRG